jgi:hypothetical protein
MRDVKRWSVTTDYPASNKTILERIAASLLAYTPCEKEVFVEFRVRRLENVRLSLFWLVPWGREHRYDGYKNGD